MTAEDRHAVTPQWVVVAGWANSSDTVHGPFFSSERAEEWAHGYLDVHDDCERWDTVLVSPAGVEVRS